MKIRFHSLFLKPLLVLSATVSMTAHAQVAFLVISLPGTTSQDTWTDLTAANYPGYPTYTTSSNSWPSPIASTGGNGDLDLNKTAGLGFPSNGGGIYVGGMSSGTGSFSIDTPVAGALASLETVVFQIEIEGVGSDWGDVLSNVNLSYNGGLQTLAPDFVQELAAINTGIVFGSPSTKFTLAFQWDLSALVEPVDSFHLTWTGAEHSLTSSLQVNQGDTMVQVVPEPSTYALLLLGVCAVVFWKKRFPGHSA